MKRFILLILMILVLIGVINNYKEDYYIIPDKSIRVRIHQKTSKNKLRDRTRRRSK